MGWRVSFITARPNHGSILSDHGFSIYHADFSYLGGSKLRMPYCWVSLLRAMKKANSNYYVLKVPGHLLAPMSIFCRLCRRKLVFWAQMTHDSNPDERKFNRISSCLQDWSVKRADIVISQSNDQRIGFKRNYDIESIVVPSICERLTSTYSERMIFHTNKREIDILWVGNALPKKRQEVFFELARLLPHRKFAIAMNNSDNVRFEQAREYAKKLPNVIFLGTVPPVEMEGWFQKTKLFLNTSIREGFPNTFLQAWMNGIPVVSLNIDPDKIISSMGLGFVAASNDISDYDDDFENLAMCMVESLETILQDDQLRQEMGKRCVNYVTKNHAPEVVIPKLLDALAF